MHTFGIFHLQTENGKELHNQKHKSPGEKKKGAQSMPGSWAPRAASGCVRGWLSQKS